MSFLYSVLNLVSDIPLCALSYDNFSVPKIKGTFLLFYFVCFILEARGGILVCMLFGFKLHNCRFQDIKLFLLDYSFFVKKMHLYGFYCLICFHLICFNILQVTWTSKIIDFFLLKNKL